MAQLLAGNIINEITTKAYLDSSLIDTEFFNENLNINHLYLWSIFGYICKEKKNHCVIQCCSCRLYGQIPYRNYRKLDSVLDSYEEQEFWID